MLPILTERLKELQLPKRPIRGLVPTFQDEGLYVVMLIDGVSVILDDKEVRQTKAAFDRMFAAREALVEPQNQGQPED